jgi:hypothetical protein|tara:strand:+ start:1696 stop:2154 length:459 start_codon:yes stop_codon:yes gene_type:complete
MNWEDIIKNSPLQKFAKIAENNGLYLVDDELRSRRGNESSRAIILVPKKYRFMEIAFILPEPSAEFLSFSLRYGIYIPAADMKDVPTVHFGNKDYEFHQQKERGKVTLDEEEFIRIIKKYKEFCKEHKDKFVKLYIHTKRQGYIKSALQPKF